MFAVLICALGVAEAGAQLAPQRSSAIAGKIFRHSDLNIPNRLEPASRLSSPIAQSAKEQLQGLDIAASRALFDRRAGRWATLLPAVRLLQRSDGPGAAWENLKGLPSPVGSTSIEAVAWKAVESYLRDHLDQLRVDLSELDPAVITVHDGGDRIQVFAGRRVEGIPVRDNYLTAVIGHGNLILLGLRNWGDLTTGTRPSISKQKATAAVTTHLGSIEVDSLRKPTELILVPTAAGRDPSVVPFGAGYRYRLAWVVAPAIRGEPGRWEALVDAHTGELLSFVDTRSYASPRSVLGGVYPVSNDGTAPDGVEQTGYPMPYTDVGSNDALLFTDGGGNHPVCVNGQLTTSLNGRFVRIDDFCGAINESSLADIDLGYGTGTDCDVPNPGVSSPGNTHAARTVYFELNRIAEQARSHLPDNLWLRDQLTAAVNIPDLGTGELNCNAFWDEKTVNFFTSGAAAPGMVCSNTGELAGVVDHEWGHGLDDNDALPTISSPGEGIADVYAALRLNDSCIARGFFLEDNLCGDTDPCTSCTGVRDIDWANRQSDQPHDIVWIDAQCAPPFLGDVGPCGGDIYCESAVYSEAIWDLVHRDLQSAPFNMDLNTALEIGTRLTYLGAGAVGNWYSCVDGTGAGDGCNADGGYLNFLAIDDDNGNLADGTPHMEAIYSAFYRHGIACATPAKQNSGCDGAPTTAPVVTATPLDRGVLLAWGAVGGASAYQIFRTEGVFGCDFGKIKVGETTGTDFFDGGLLNDFEYSYIVIPVGGDDSCVGPASGCAQVTPTRGANLGFDPTSLSVEILNGDLDPVIDNCEQATVHFDLINLGSGDLSNVRVVDVEVVSHPGTVTVTSSLPLTVAPSLSPCSPATASFSFLAQGLSFNDTLEFRIQATSDELAGRVASQEILLHGSETGLAASSSTTFSFESDLEGWQPLHGTFERSDAGGGAGGSSFFVASSNNLANQCDVIRSPLLYLTADSTMSLWTSYDIEPYLLIEGFPFWFDRANVSLFEVESGRRTPVSPDGGRLYNASGPDGPCDTSNQLGWADTATTWEQSTWSATALGSGLQAGDLVQLDVRYGTDAEVQGTGFRFDELTLTDIKMVIDDSQTDICSEGNSPPVALDDPATVHPSASTTVPVLSNDNDPDPGDTLRVLAVTQPSLGTTGVNSVGPDLDTVTYTTQEGPGGIDTFLYSITDGKGGSDIASVDVERDFIFYSDFETGGTSVWSFTSTNLGTCEPDGTYTVSPSILYSCCLGLVDIEINEFLFTADGAQISSAPFNPGDLIGSPTSCPAGTFSNTGSITGGCTETYSLEGSFSDANTWNGTFSVTFTGLDCDCWGVDPCVDQNFVVTGTR
jgi:hypothetical protein